MSTSSVISYSFYRIRIVNNEGITIGKFPELGRVQICIRRGRRHIIVAMTRIFCITYKLITIDYRNVIKCKHKISNL